MKIGIVTQPLSRNYGGILQNYALQQVLIKLGHTPFTFDLRISYIWRVWVIITIKNIIKYIIGRPCKFPQTIFAVKSQEKILRSFVENNITIIKPRTKRLTADSILRNNLDAIIVGSDQVWRPKYNYCIQDMYLYFAKDLDIKRVAYAASFGVDKWEYTDEQTEVCKSLAQKFDAISVREQSGVDLCEKYLDVEAKHVVDPTLLLTADDYKKLLTHIPEVKSQYLFAYILDQTYDKIEYTTRYAENLGLEIVIKGANGKLLKDDSIESWLANFRDAKYIITDSFHGCVFSIVFNKPFIALGNRVRGMERFNSLLEILGLEDNLFDLTEKPVRFINYPNWSEVNAKVSLYRKKSLEFLRANL